MATETERMNTLIKKGKDHLHDNGFNEGCNFNINDISSEMAAFALQILSENLESNCYSFNNHINNNYSSHDIINEDCDSIGTSYFCLRTYKTLTKEEVYQDWLLTQRQLF